VSIIFGFLVEGLLIGIGLAQRSLKEAAMAVYEPLVKGDFAEARVKLSWIVGRDTEKLDEDEIVRGVVETVSENTSDGVTAPL
uniref:cobalamin biosynthesis protein CobD/CbiB n=1 Tax=Bacillus paralicheniformis TaxID=1648923 RepID=UPI0020BD6A24